MIDREHLELVVPDDPEKRRSGCSVLGLLAIIVLFATSQGAIDHGNKRPVSGGLLPGTPLSEAGHRLQLSASSLNPGSPPLSGHVGSPSVVPSEAADTTAPPETASIFSGGISATWCAPRGAQCRGWQPPALFGAVHSFRWGDTPYQVRVSRGAASVVVTVVSYCDCGGSDAAIDLSPAAFDALSPDRPHGSDTDPGRVTVEVEGPIEPLPNTSMEETR